MSSTELMNETAIMDAEDYRALLAFEEKIAIVVPTFFALIVLIGLTGNALVILVVAMNPTMRNSTNVLIVNLALADLLFLLLCVPFTATDYAMAIWVFAVTWCSVLQYLQSVSAYASVWTLVFMAVDRFLAVVFPVQSMTLKTTRNTLIVSALGWAIIVLVNIPVFSIHGIYEYQFMGEIRTSCTYVAHANRSASEREVRLFYLSFNVFGYILPFTITCFLYYMMIRRLAVGARRKCHSSIRASKDNRMKQKVTRTVTAVIVTFAVCWLPLNICFCLAALTYQEGRGSMSSEGLIVFQIFAHTLAYANSCLNPILYGFLSEPFRKGFYKIGAFIFCLKGRSSHVRYELATEFRSGSRTFV